MSHVTLLQGDGGTGKTTIALQLCAAVALGRDWLGAVIDEPGPVMFLSAEEDRDELHRRIGSIVGHLGIAYQDLDAVHLLGMPDEDIVLGAPPKNSDTIAPTPLFHRLEQAACDLRPKLIVIEAAADVFAGNENNRSQVRQFLGLLRRLGRKVETAVMLLQHPSLTGLGTGTGNSGSTQWSNSCRSRLNFTTTKDDPAVRQLEVMKANYGPKGEAFKVQWNRGVFVPWGAPPDVERAATEAVADEVFLKCLDIKKSQRVEVVMTTGHGYAPKVFNDMPEVKAKGLNKLALVAAMERLHSAGKIRVDHVGGPPSKKKYGIVRAE